ncbi:MAG TPA: ATP-binding protein [Isosphaeraceae bacterium]|nr:ATP-binding protein [Isosphaeraceae bacterium]
MRPTHSRKERLGELRRRIERLGGLPLRPSTAKRIVASLPNPEPDSLNQLTEIDPGWILARALPDAGKNPLALVAGRPWWPLLPTEQANALERLWRHAVAVSCAARRLAQEAADPQPEALAQVGLLHNLGYWALAAVEPDRLALILAIVDATERRDRERAWLGMTATELGRTLAEAWGADAALIDAAWLHADLDRGLSACAEEPDRLALIQQAYAWAERTPWAMDPPAVKEPCATDPRVRLLIAEVQARCPSAFVEPATVTEERLARDNARLRLQVRDLVAAQAIRDHLIDALAEAQPADTAEAWAEHAAQAWSNLPGVAQAEVAWACDRTSSDPAPDQTLTLRSQGRPIAEVRLWKAAPKELPRTAHQPSLAAWGSWAGLVADRARLARRLEAVLEAHRRKAEREAPARLGERLAALAEFAAGAGHELNNPLAVILGRAQLLLAQQTDPQAMRSLRAIIGQAQRAHRILRDLMYVARPPAPRTRPCQPDEIVRACLRDLQVEADARGIRLIAEAREPGPVVWADPDPIRHLTETLTRNALEATAAGGTIRVTIDGDPGHLAWTVQDSGRGLSPTEAEHLFDPFFCGRQAGRGLGLGLPRVARFVEQKGGQIRWRSTPGRGTTFHLTLPLDASPTAPSLASGVGSDASAGNGHAR